MASAGKKLLFYSALILIWQGLFLTRLWPEYLFPSPLSVLARLTDGFADHQFTTAIIVSMRRLTAGYALSVVLGILLGMALAHWKWVDETLGSLVAGLQTLPSICWLPLALLWFGLNDSAIVFVVVMGSVMSIAMAARSGIKHVSPQWINAAQTMGAYRSKLYVHVILPAMLPSFVDGMRQGWSFAWRSLMAGELLFVSMGLGHLLSMGRELNDMSQVIAVMITIVLLGLATDRLVFGAAEKRLSTVWGLK